jgi:hypothetical protein
MVSETSHLRTIDRRRKILRVRLRPQRHPLRGETTDDEVRELLAKANHRALPISPELDAVGAGVA